VNPKATMPRIGATKLVKTSPRHDQRQFVLKFFAGKATHREPCETGDAIAGINNAKIQQNNAENLAQ